MARRMAFSSKNVVIELAHLLGGKIDVFGQKTRTNWLKAYWAHLKTLIVFTR